MPGRPYTKPKREMNHNLHKNKKSTKGIWLLVSGFLSQLGIGERLNNTADPKLDPKVNVQTTEHRSLRAINTLMVSEEKGTPLISRAEMESFND